MKILLSLSQPALLASVSYLILSFAILLPLNQWKTSPTKPPLIMRIFMLLIMIIPFSLSVYSINCMMRGGCKVWSYFQSILIAVWVFLFIVAALISRENVIEKFSF